MPVNQELVTYTYLIQGSKSATPPCQATDLARETVWSRNDPLHVGTSYDVQGCNGFNEVILQCSDATDMGTYPRTTLINVNDAGPEHLDHIDFYGFGWGSIAIETLDVNNNVIPYGVLGCSINQTAYERWCLVSTDPNVYSELYVVPCVFYNDVLGLPDQLGFCILGHVTPIAKALFTISFEYVLLGWNPAQWDFWDDMLDGQYADLEGIAPTGGQGGGGGYYNRPDEEIGIPGLPSISVCDTGFVSLYEVSPAEIQALGSYLWTSNFVDTIKKVFQSPFDNIVSLQMIPFTPPGTPTNIKIGNVDTGLQGDKLSTSYFEIDCGVKYVEEFFKTFADYAPYTKIHIFIPYCGIFELNPDDVLSSSGGGVKVVYHIDVFSGSCVAFVQCNSGGKWHVLQQHAGNISAQFPITGANFASVYIGAINAIGSVAGGIASGGMGVLSGGISGASQISNIKPEYQRSGGVTSVSGIMGIQYPYLIYSTPQYIVAENFRDVKGHVSNLKCTVSSCSGFLQATADNSELSGIGCTAYELDLIRGLLAEGIYV